MTPNQMRPFRSDESMERIASVIEATEDFQGKIDQLAAKVDSLRTRLTEEEKLFSKLLADCAATLRMASTGMDDAINYEKQLIGQDRRDARARSRGNGS